MEMKTCLIIFALLCTVYCKPADMDDPSLDDFQNDDENNVYGDYDEEEKGTEEVGKISEEDNTAKEEKPSTIVTVGQEFIANVNDTIKLPCEISGSNYVQIWRKNEAILFQSKIGMGAAPNMKQLADGSLEISTLQEEDAGDYVCVAMNTQKNSPQITHSLKVRTKPRIELLAAKDNMTVLKSGDTLSLTCKASGYPKPRISWHKSSKRIGTEGEVLTIYKVKHHDAGQYKCFADNGVGKPDFKPLTIKVEYKPVVTIERISVSSDSNSDTELKCMVHAEPPATVVWKKNGVNIASNEHNELSIDKNSHILIIKGLQESDFGVYTCFASNYLGDTKKNIKLVKTPAILRFIKPRSDAKEVVLTWEVQSKLPVSQHDLQYRRKGENEWLSLTPEVSSAENDVYTVNYTLKGLDPGVYETRLRAENKYGWSEFSENMPFEGVYAKHGHHKSHKKGHKDGREKHFTPTQEVTTQATAPLKTDAPAEHQENERQSDLIKDASVRGTNTSGCSSITSTMSLISIALIVYLQVRPPTI